jgi:hypothetical protein
VLLVGLAASADTITISLHRHDRPDSRSSLLQGGQRIRFSFVAIHRPVIALSAPCRSVVAAARGVCHHVIVLDRRVAAREIGPSVSLKGAAAAADGGFTDASGSGKELSQTKLLERMRQQKKEVGWAEKFALSFAPKSSADEFKLNWVGNIDRHQRELFWKLIVMLCNKIDPYLTWMRIAHDIIERAKKLCCAVIAFIGSNLVPTLHMLALACARHAFLLTRESVILLRLFMLQAGTRLAHSMVQLVGLGVTLPPPTAPHAAAMSLGATVPWWKKLSSQSQAPRGFQQEASKSTNQNDVYSMPAPQRFQTQYDFTGDSVLFPSTSPISTSSARRAGGARGVGEQEKREEVAQGPPEGAKVAMPALGGKGVGLRRVLDLIQSVDIVV